MRLPDSLRDELIRLLAEGRNVDDPEFVALLDAHPEARQEMETLSQIADAVERDAHAAQDLAREVLVTDADRAAVRAVVIDPLKQRARARAWRRSAARWLPAAAALFLALWFWRGEFANDDSGGGGLLGGDYRCLAPSGDEVESFDRFTIDGELDVGATVHIRVFALESAELLEETPGLEALEWRPDDAARAHLEAAAAIRWEFEVLDVNRSPLGSGSAEARLRSD